MEFEFPKIEKITVYPRTFLKDVCVSLCFRPVLSCDNAIRNFIGFRKEYFNISSEELADLKTKEEDGSVKIWSSDNQIIFEFYLDAVFLKIKIPTYKQFGNLMAFMPVIAAFLKTQGIDKLENIRITKFNETQYGFQSDFSSVDIAMKGIFSPEMMGWDGFENPDFSNVARWERRIDFSDDQDDARAMVLYGFIKDDINRKKGSITLKTSVEKSGPIEMLSLNSELERCNVWVDSAFHWAASDDIIKEMQKK